MGISNRDWIKLSAYLDGELSAREEQVLTKRLHSEPDLKAALNDLNTAKRVLQSTPKLAVPRNFTLTSKMVGFQLKKPRALGYQLATAAMTVLLVGTLVLDFSRFLVGGAMAPAAPRMEEAMLESAVDEAAEPLVSEMEVDVMEDRAAADAVEEVIVEGEALEPEAEEQELTFGMAAEKNGEGVSLPVEEQDAETNLMMQTGVPQATGQVLPSETPAPDPPVEGIEVDEESYSISRPREIPIFRILEIVFGLGVIGFGTATWMKRRRKI
jgi:hypothetical protein